MESGIRNYKKQKIYKQSWSEKDVADNEGKKISVILIVFGCYYYHYNQVTYYYHYFMLLLKVNTGPKENIGKKGVEVLRCF